jgi:hypothetical protein
MARLAQRDPRKFALNDRGAVYVEFLIVFMPIFLLFLGICQIAMIGVARIVVQHAANRAARSAVVVLESDPNEFAGAERGWVSRGSACGAPLPEALLRRLGVEVPSARVELSTVADGQRGARMSPIRFAAYTPLAILAPLSAWLEPRRPEESLGDALATGTKARLAAALLYNRVGTVVTIQAGPGLDDLAVEPIGRKAPVTVRVTYLYYCSIPVVRAFACKSLAELRGWDPVGSAAPDARTPSQKRLASFLKLVEEPELLAHLDADGARFAVLTAETTLPNQGAAYY